MHAFCKRVNVGSIPTPGPISTQNKLKMPSFETPGVPTPEESAKAMRAMTGCVKPENPDNRRPRCYDQCVEAPVTTQIANTNGDAYQE